MTDLARKAKELLLPGNAKRIVWENPRESIGVRQGDIQNSKYSCWRVAGRAKSTWDELRPKLKKVLDGVGTTSLAVVMLEMYMIGRTEDTAIPTILVCSRDKHVRRSIKQSLKASQILIDYPNIALGDTPQLPDRRQVQQIMLAIRGTRRRAVLASSSRDSPLSLPDVPSFDPDQRFHLPSAGEDTDASDTDAVFGDPDSTARPGRRLYYFQNSSNSDPGEPRIATGGPIIYIKNQAYQLTVAHLFLDLGAHAADAYFGDSSDEECEIEGLDDDDAPEESSDMLEATSRGSQTPPDLGSWTSDSHSSSGDVLLRRKDASGVISQGAADGPEPFGPDRLRSRVEVDLGSRRIKPRRKVGSIAWTSDWGDRPSLDYALVKISNGVHSNNLTKKSTLRGTGPTDELHTISELATIQHDDVDVVVGTTSGVVGGTLISSPSLIRLPGQKEFQETYMVQIKGTWSEGDCGAAVVGQQSNGFYGQIAAGTPGTDLGYIIPASQILSDISTRMGADASFAPSAIQWRRKGQESVAGAPPIRDLSSWLINMENILVRNFPDKSAKTSVGKLREGVEAPDETAVDISEVVEPPEISKSAEEAESPQPLWDIGAETLLYPANTPHPANRLTETQEDSLIDAHSGPSSTKLYKSPLDPPQTLGYVATPSNINTRSEIAVEKPTMSPEKPTMSPNIFKRALDAMRELRQRHKRMWSQSHARKRHPSPTSLQSPPSTQIPEEPVIQSAVKGQSLIESQLRTTLVSLPEQSSSASAAMPKPSSRSSPLQQPYLHNATYQSVSSGQPIDAEAGHPEHLLKTNATTSPMAGLAGAVSGCNEDTHDAAFDTTSEPDLISSYPAQAPRADDCPAPGKKPVSDRTSQYVERPESLEYNGDTSTGALAQLGAMDFQVQIPDSRWISVKVMIDTGMERSFIMKSFLKAYDIPSHPLRSDEMIGVLGSPIFGGIVTPNRFVSRTHLKWRSSELGFEFRADLLLSDIVDNSDKNDIVAVFGRGLIQRRNLLQLVTKKPQIASPGILVARKRGHATKTAHEEAWISEQKRFEAHLNQSEASSKSGQDTDITSSQGKSSSATSQSASDKNTR